MENYVDGKVIIVTGGSSGFGKATAKLLLQQGGRVVITGRNQQRLDEAAAELASDNLLAIQADAVSTDDWKRLVEATVQTFGCIDVLINNHGNGGLIAPTEEQTDENIQKTLDINIASVIKGCREVIGVMKPAGRGHIINVSSACARHGWPAWGVYTAAKAGMVMFTRCLHLEMATWGGKATSFIPGAAKTNFCGNCDIDDSWMDGYPTADDFARSMLHCVDVPDNTVIEELNVWGTKQLSEFPAL